MTDLQAQKDKKNLNDDLNGLKCKFDDPRVFSRLYHYYLFTRQCEAQWKLSRYQFTKMEGLSYKRLLPCLNANFRTLSSLMFPCNQILKKKNIDTLVCKRHIDI